MLESPIQSQFLPSSREDWEQNQFLHFKYSMKTRPNLVGPVCIGSYQFENQSGLIFGWTSSPTNIVLTTDRLIYSIMIKISK